MCDNDYPCRDEIDDDLELEEDDWDDDEHDDDWDEICYPSEPFTTGDDDD